MKIIEKEGGNMSSKKVSYNNKGISDLEKEGY